MAWLVASRLEEIRKSRDISAYRLAKLTGIADTSIRKVEKGQHGITLTNCLRIADALGVNLGDVIKQVLKDEKRRSRGC